MVHWCNLVLVVSRTPQFPILCYLSMFGRVYLLPLEQVVQERKGNIALEVTNHHFCNIQGVTEASVFNKRADYIEV